MSVDNRVVKYAGVFRSIHTRTAFSAMAPSRSNTGGEQINVTTVGGGVAHLKKVRPSF